MQVSFIEACIAFFGLKEGQSRMQFLKDEVKPLTNVDRVEIADGLRTLGVDINLASILPAKQ